MIPNAVPRSHRSPTKPFFSEDFDMPHVEPSAAPEIIEPVFTAEELATARAAAWAEGRDAALAELERVNAEAIESMARSVTEQISTVMQQAERHATELAQLLLDILATLFPALCCAHGPDEARALTEVLRTGLTRYPAVTLRASPALAEYLITGLAAAPLKNYCNVEVIQTKTPFPGDIQISWTDGVAERDAAVLWNQVTTVLARSGLQCQTINAEPQHAT